MLSLGGLLEHECPRCHRAVELPLGALCDECRAEIRARAARLARWSARVTTVLVALYVWLRMPAEAAPAQQLVGIMGVAIWYMLTYRVVQRAARELIK